MFYLINSEIDNFCQAEVIIHSDFEAGGNCYMKTYWLPYGRRNGSSWEKHPVKLLNVFKELT